MRTLLWLCAACLFMVCGATWAAPCDSDAWKPSFVHDLENPDGPWFVTQGGFIQLQGSSNTWVGQACKLIASRGLQDRRGFTNCQEYTRVQCGCSRYVTGNSICARFLADHPTAILRRPTVGSAPAGSGGGSSVGGAGTQPWGVWANRMNPNLPWSDPCNIQYVISPSPSTYDRRPSYVRVRNANNRNDANQFLQLFSQFYDDQPDSVVKMSTCHASTRLKSGHTRGSDPSGGHGHATTTALEYGINRMGGDYNNPLREPGASDAQACAARCAGESRCRSFTWVKPGVQGNLARCWLKDSVPSASRNGCCVSGVK
ncbi:MAG: PAN domain-containing protein [Pseudomonadota bacterium]